MSIINVYQGGIHTLQISHRLFKVAGSVVLYCVVHTLQMMKSRWSGIVFIRDFITAAEHMLSDKTSLRDKVASSKISARGLSCLNVHYEALAFSSMWYSGLGPATKSEVLLTRSIWIGNYFPHSIF